MSQEKVKHKCLSPYKWRMQDWHIQDRKCLTNKSHPNYANCHLKYSCVTIHWHFFRIQTKTLAYIHTLNKAHACIILVTYRLHTYLCCDNKFKAWAGKGISTGCLSWRDESGVSVNYFLTTWPCHHGCMAPVWPFLQTNLNNYVFIDDNFKILHRDMYLIYK